MDARRLADSEAPLLERLIRHWPGQCVVCRSWGPRRLCASCEQLWVCPGPRCRSCGLRLPASLASAPQPRCGHCLTHPPPLACCIAALDYGFPWAGLLQAFKFEQALHMWRPLLDQLDLALERDGAEAPDWLLPVPLSRERLRERGYNQSWELARRLARLRRLPCSADMLVRLRDTAHQLDLPADARLANVRQAFGLAPGHASQLRGARVALLDDVMTTGATLHELARTLLHAGAAEVQAWVVARTPAHRE